MEELERGSNYKCVMGVTGPQPIIVNQVVGFGETQKSLDIHMRVPKRKPAIEQIIDVYVRRPHITHVEVLTGKVIVRGFFEAKTVYVACLPSQPVHAVEARRIRFTAEVPICNARCGMDADASVAIEYVDYDCDHNCRPYWHKQWERYQKPKYIHEDDCGCDDDHHGHDGWGGKSQQPKKGYKKKHHDPDCDHDHHDHDDCNHDHGHHDYEDDCGCDKKHHHDDDCGCDKKHHHDDCDSWCPPKKKPRRCCREFDISIVIQVKAKVYSCREIAIQQQYYPVLPIKPKG